MHFRIFCMDSLDCIFLHIPKLRNYYRPIDQFIWINFIPIGLIGLADLLHRHNISTQIVHLGVEWIEDHNFSILQYIQEKMPRMVAIDLHWHHQGFDAIEVAKKLKANFPSIYVLLGGFTASFFHEEIMRNFDAIDGIIRGEAERPMLELAQALLSGSEDLFSIPNLTWRKKGRIFINPLSYISTEKDLNKISFTNFKLLKNYPTYIHYVGQPFYVKGVSKERNFSRYSLKSPTHHLMVGRGCPARCTWCSGNISSQEMITGRKEVTYRGVEEVIMSIKEAISYGYETFHICFDPFPKDPEYFLKLFSIIRKEGIKTDCLFESFGLPTEDFIRSFKETFPGQRSFIAISPDVGSDRLRGIHKGNSYTNQELMICLDQMRSHQVFCDVFFTLGVPFEKEEDIFQTLRLQIEIRRRYQNVRGIRTFTISMEPCSSIFLNPEEFGVETSIRTFMDFYHYHSLEENPFSSLGYWIPDYFKGIKNEKEFERELLRIKCKYFCSFHPDPFFSSTPFWGRRLCDLSSLLWKIKNFSSGIKRLSG